MARRNYATTYYARVKWNLKQKGINLGDIISYSSWKNDYDYNFHEQLVINDYLCDFSLEYDDYNQEGHFKMNKLTGKPINYNQSENYLYGYNDNIWD